MTKKVFITGGNGFLGKHLISALKNLNYDITAPSSEECDLRNPESLKQYDTKFDQIFHLAAWTQAGDFCLYHPGEQWVINQQMNTNILHWWSEKQTQAKMIAMGTSCSYDPKLPLEEEYYLQGTPIESLYTYAMVKRMLLIGLESLAKQFNLEYLYLIPSTLYGPGYHTDGRQMHFIFDLMRKIILAKERGQKVELWGDGYQKRELVYVNDFISVLLNLDKTQKNTIFNIGAGKEFTIREFAAMICKHVGYDPDKIHYDTSKYVGAKSKCLSTKKHNQANPDNTKTSLSDGLKNTVAWFQENKALLLNS